MNAAPTSLAAVGSGKAAVSSPSMEIGYSDSICEILPGRVNYYPFGLQMPGRVYVQGSETREGFTGHELDQETGMYYAGARYYMPALGRWTSVDPLADQFPSWSPYNYVLNNPVSLMDPTGMAPDPPVWLRKASVWLRKASFAVQHPIAAPRIGTTRNPLKEAVTGQQYVDQRPRTNISTVSTRFAINMSPRHGGALPLGEGTTGNAFRHLLWQASIASEFGSVIARSAGNAHELNPNAYLEIGDAASARLTLADADQYADLMNNYIGRAAGRANKGASALDLALIVLGIMYENGAYVATENEDGTYGVVNRRLSREEYNKAKSRLSELGDEGWEREDDRNQGGYIDASRSN